MPPSTPSCLQGSAPAGAAGGGHSELAQALMLFIPTSFDLIATVLMNVGLLSGGGLPTTLAYTQPCSLHLCMAAG